jgi:hypothetical protein
MDDKGLGNIRGAYLLAKICSIFVKGIAMEILGVDAQEEAFVDDG